MAGLPNVRTGTVAWGIVGTAILALAGYLVYSFVGAILLGLFLYYALRPVCRWLDERSDHPSLNATATLLVVGVPLVTVLTVAGLTLVRELDQLLRVANAQQYRGLIQPFVDLAARLRFQRIGTVVRNALPRVFDVLGVLLTWGLRLFVATTVAYYLLRDDWKIAAWFRDTFRDEYGAVEFAEGVDDDLTTMYTGNLITIALTGVIAVAVFYGLDIVAPAGTGVTFPVLLGALTGVATLIPAVGMKLVYVPYSLFLLWDAIRTSAAPLWFPVVFFLVTLLVVDTFPDIFVRSYVSSGGINMGLMLLTYTLGAVAFGWYGVFLAQSYS